uniref:Uncharacterized protein n=1 Tax=Arundo donax TaxID=35708 RepID=A0A0A9GZ61_ARUDO
MGIYWPNSSIKRKKKLVNKKGSRFQREQMRNQIATIAEISVQGGRGKRQWQQEVRRRRWSRQPRAAAAGVQKMRTPAEVDEAEYEGQRRSVGG